MKKNCKQASKSKCILCITEEGKQRERERERAKKALGIGPFNVLKARTSYLDDFTKV